jgi:hypothetical protein
MPASSGVEVVGTDELVEQELASENSYEGSEDEQSAMVSRQLFESSLAGHISYAYQQNKDARRDSGIEQEMLESMDAFNGEYTKSDRSAIEQAGGSKIFMNITATKCRACASWIKDIMMPASDKAWRLQPSKDPEINPFLMDEIEGILDKEYAMYEKNSAAKREEIEGGTQRPPSSQGAQAPPQGGQPGPQASPPPDATQGAQPAQAEPQPPSVGALATSLREMNKARRDIQNTYKAEVEMIARDEMKKLERIIEGQLDKGQWNKALGEFIEDFTIYPAAFLKGPVINVKPSLTYNEGKPVVTSEVVYINKRISPLDIYPSANATTINDGDIIEHIRFQRSEIAELKGLDNYDDAKITEVLDNYQGSEFTHWLWTDIESDKAYAEKRGNEFQANRNIIHGLHYFGKASVRMLREWGMTDKDLQDSDGNIYEPTDELEVEALMVDSTVIKVQVNTDPLVRRPYYKASFQNRPGSYWGRSLPNLMRDIQRMCNATARALSNNMGMASGPQVELYVDRLADKGDITDITPMKIWQLTSDPTGAGGRAIQFTQPSSNAAELLAVYKEFELRADDATGIPRYAYGNERTGGAAQTASGLSMLLESASKGIKDAIRHIDEGVLIPRLEYQFYWLMSTDDNLGYSGDITVIPKGSSALTMKAAEQGKRLELMQTLSGNPAILEVVGPEAMAEVFRVLFEDANMPEMIIPSGLEIRQAVEKKEAQAAEAGKMQAETANKKTEAGIQATKLQIDGQIQMHQGTMQLKSRELDIKDQDSLAKARGKSQELDSRERQTAQRALADAEQSKATRDFEDATDRRDKAFQLTDTVDQGSKSPSDVAGGRQGY